MEFKKFLEEVESRIKDYLPDSYRDASVYFHEVSKNNNLTLIAMNIQKPEENVTPSIYMGAFYDDYVNGKSSIDDVCKDIAQIRIEHEKKMDISQIINSDTVKDSIVFNLVGTENNKELLSNMPHRIVNDMAIKYQILVPTDEPKLLTANISNKLMHYLDMDENQLYELAMKNTPVLMPPVLKTMSEVFREMTGMDASMLEMMGMDEDVFEEMETNPMYVLTNNQRANGAATLYYPDTLEIIYKKLQSDYYVLPSSIHETIILPKQGAMGTEELRNMVNEVNCTQVLPEEVLTGNVYEYDARAKVLTIADDPLYKANKADIKQSGFKLTKSLEKNMESLNKATGKNNTLKDVKEILNNDEAAEHVKGIAEDIAKECKQQEILREAPEV